MSVATEDKSVVIAGLIERIQSEPNVRRRKAEVQRTRLNLEEELAAITLKFRQRMNECVDEDITGDAILSAIDQDKIALLDATAEGKQIRALQAEIKEIRWTKGDPQLLVLSRRRDMAHDRGEEAEAERLESLIAKLQSKIDQKQREIDRIWMSFGFEAESLPKV